MFVQILLLIGGSAAEGGIALQGFHLTCSERRELTLVGKRFKIFQVFLSSQTPIKVEGPEMSTDPLFALIEGADHREVGGIELDIVPAGKARVKRMIYPPGFRWSTHMKPVAQTDYCMHAHVGFLARGRIHVIFSDGCTMDFVAPRVVVVEPGHDTWVVGDERCVFIEFDFERETVQRLGLPDVHRHDRAGQQ